MRSLNSLPVLLALIVCGVSCGPSYGQDFEFDESIPSPVAPTDRVERVINAPNPSDHAGLLGKMYMQQRYLQVNIDDREVRRLDDSLQGFDTFFNLPAITLDLPTPLDLDVFFGYTNAGIKGSANTGPPLNVLVSVNSKIEVYSVGTTIYFTEAERLRPFVQVGAEFNRSDIDFAVSNGLNTLAANVVDNDSELLLNAGFEFDLLDSMGYRLTVDIETRDRFRDSMVMNELILWLHERIFVRGGMVTSLDSGGLGYAIGGGLAF